MRTSATGNSSRPTPRAAGFTLIELLVVVVIVGIVSSVVLLSVGLLGDDRQLRDEARRIASLVELAADEAVLQGRDYGLEFTRDGYRFVEYDPYLEQWREIEGDDLLRRRSLSAGLRLELSVEDRSVTLQETPVEIEAEEPRDAEAGGLRRLRPAARENAGYAPHALLLSSGDLTPFRLWIRRASDRAGIALEVTPGGDIEITDGSDDAPG